MTACTASTKRRPVIAARLEQRFGPPDLTLGGFRLWVHWLERDEDQVEGDWLVISACCEDGDREAWLEELPVLQLAELRAWLADCELLAEQSDGEATLTCLEPHLALQATVTPARLTLRVGISPEERPGTVELELSVARTELAQLLADGRKLLGFYPAKNPG